MGCDVELVEPRSEAFISDYFTSEEQACIQATTVDRSQLVALLWSAKESVLKALHEGLRLDTRSVTVESITWLDEGGWNPLQVRHAGGQIFHGWWRCAGRMVRTVVADQTAERPIAIALKTPSLDSVFQCV